MVVLDHTIVAARDNHRSAVFLADILGLPEPETLGPFALVRVGESTTLDFVETDGPVTSQHYAFRVTEAEFDAAFARIKDHDLPYWADPQQHEPGQINTWDGGRGVYFEDPNGHLLEILTRSYGTGGTRPRDRTRSSPCRTRTRRDETARAERDGTTYSGGLTTQIPR